MWQQVTLEPFRATHCS